MTHLAGPSTKTIAYRLLAALDAAPDGMLTDAQLMPMLALVSRTADKLAVQINILATSGLVRRTPDALQILPRGKQYMQQNYSEKVYQALPEPKSVYVGVIAPPRTAPAFKPLDMTRMMRGRPQRDGMDDYRSMPSMMGGTRVAMRAQK